ncbi:MAG: phasin family protein [Alphaproteobacteria bacterium]|nr:phasin family protein [Alphaproteobacteria bacterium]
MADPKNPFADFQTEMQKLMGDFKMPGFGSMPGFDMGQLMETQRRNIAAFTEANKLAMEGMQAMMKRQSEVLQQLMEEANRNVQTFMTDRSPNSQLARQTEFAKEGFERAIANLREMGEMMQKSNSEAFGVINQRVSDSLDELRQLLQKKGK